MKEQSGDLEVESNQYSTIDAGTFIPRYGNLGASNANFSSIGNFNMGTVEYEIRDIKSKFEHLYATTTDLKSDVSHLKDNVSNINSELKIANQKFEHINDDIVRLTNATQTNADLISDVKSTLTDLKNETKLDFKDIEIKFGDKLRDHMRWTITAFIAVSIAVGTISYRSNTQLEAKFNKLEERVNKSLSGIDGKLARLLENQQQNASKIATVKKVDKTILITKQQMKSVIAEAIKEAEQAKLTTDIAMIAQTDKTAIKVQ